jgi:hypothetical protein
MITALALNASAAAARLLRRVLEEAKSFNTEDTKDTEEFSAKHLVLTGSSGGDNRTILRPTYADRGCLDAAFL